MALRTPTFDDLLNIRAVGEVRISPDGRRIAYGMCCISGPGRRMASGLSGIRRSVTRTGCRRRP